MKMSFLLSLAVLAVASSGLTACSSESKSEKFTYNYTVNGCNTNQSFTSREAYCAGLKDDALNNGCARQMRRQAFEQNCSGSFENLTVEEEALLRVMVEGNEILEEMK